MCFVLFLSVENMHKYTNEIVADNTSQRFNRNRYTLGDYFGEDNTTAVCYHYSFVSIVFVVFDVVACRSYDMLVLVLIVFCIVLSINRKTKKLYKGIVFFLRFLLCVKVIYFSSI